MNMDHGRVVVVVVDIRGSHLGAILILDHVRACLSSVDLMFANYS